jgi:hypothetical protein
VVQLNLWFLLRPARAVSIEIISTAKPKDANTFIYKNRKNLMFYKERMKLKGQRVLWVWGTKKIYEPGNPNVFQGTDEIKRPKAKGFGGPKR